MSSGKETRQITRKKRSPNNTTTKAQRLRKLRKTQGSRLKTPKDRRTSYVDARRKTTYQKRASNSPTYNNSNEEKELNHSLAKLIIYDPKY